MTPTPDHRLSHETALHTAWDNGLAPELEVRPGSVVAFDCLNDNGPRIGPETDSADLYDHEFVGHHLTGPVRVAGADPGDVLEIEILDVSHADWGYTMIHAGERGAGLLPEDFAHPFLYHWDLDPEAGVAHFEAGIDLPTQPFPGVVGLAPAEPGAHDTGPPRCVGGNLDTKHLTPGSTLYLPVEVAGGLLSVGDGHALQGDGEVCISAIETPTEVVARVDVREDLDLDAPHYETAGPFEPPGGGPTYAATGVEPDLMDAAKEAVRGLIDRLVDARALSPEEAYVLCSVAADLKINELVDEPNYVVSAHVSRRLLDADRG